MRRCKETESDSLIDKPATPANSIRILEVISLAAILTSQIALRKAFISQAHERAFKKQPRRIVLYLPFGASIVLELEGVEVEGEMINLVRRDPTKRL
jgi:hypothetical protein